ncbi:MAG: ribonuclease HII [Chthoniobacteraceae bacterium]
MKCSFRHERALYAQGLLCVAGIDEAGRGPLAGPVVAAAVILPGKYSHKLLTDSKELSPQTRDNLHAELLANPKVCVGVAIVGVEEIDCLNILRATHEAMRRAVSALSSTPDHVLIDGLPVLPFPIPQTALVGGDRLSFSIAAASVVAKVTRDRLMIEHDAQFPDYEFARHKGYGTALHLERLRKHGPCEIHRRSFFPVREAFVPLV